MAGQMHHAYPRSPNHDARSYTSSSVSSATSPKQQYLPDGSTIMSSARPPLPPPQHLAAGPHPGMHPLPPVNASPGYPTYAPMSSGSLFGRDSIASTDSMASTPGPPPHAHLAVSGATTPGGGGLASQKRAYRQRRKDPSCDACRERKVKCDATETTSCSECSSRNVKCQFTKETNRRMSSIKQVQDLEKQMHQVRRENSHLRRKLEGRDGASSTLGLGGGSGGGGSSVGGGSDMDVVPESEAHTPLQSPSDELYLPPVGAEPRRIQRPAPLPELSRTRLGLRDYAKGIFKLPPQHRGAPAPGFEPSRPELPRRETTEHLLLAYYRLAHTMFPMIHWPTFQASVDDLYAVPLARVPPSFLAMFFAVLATGSLFSSETTPPGPTAAELLEVSRTVTDPWANDVDLDTARATVLTALCLSEMNLQTAAGRAVATAVRLGQELGLHTETGPWPTIEGEMRRRTWWATYILDRTVASEPGGLPALIDDSDADVALPVGVDDQFIRHDGMYVPSDAQPLTHSLLAVIHVVRCYTGLFRTLAAPVVSHGRLVVLESHLQRCLESSFPPQCHPSSSLPLAPHFLGPLAYLLHARMLLHRHNLGPRSPPAARLAAVEGCTLVALDTATLVQRTASPDAAAVTHLLAVHLFRCALFLLLTGYLDQAAACIRVLASSAHRRDVAVPCGRYLGLFVSVLGPKRHEHADYLERSLPPAVLRNPHDRHSALLQSLAVDEDLLAYVSADLQASLDNSWVWSSTEPLEPTGTPGAPTTSSAPASNPYAHTLFSADVRTGLTADEARDWGGWARLEAAALALANTGAPAAPSPPRTEAPWSAQQQQQQQQPLPPQHHHASKSEVPTALPSPAIPHKHPAELPRISDAPRYTTTASPTPTRLPGDPASGPTTPAGDFKRANDRLSIANII